MTEVRRPKILADSREQTDRVFIKLMEAEDKTVEIGVKSGGSADYVIIDIEGNMWGIERKAFLDCFSSIIKKEADGDHRIYGQLTQLIKDYGERAIFLLESPTYFPVQFKKIPPHQIKQTVYTFFSERSLIMPCMMTADKAHTAYLLLKLAKNIHKTEFHGRGIKVIKD